MHRDHPYCRSSQYSPHEKPRPWRTGWFASLRGYWALAQRMIDASFLRVGHPDLDGPQKQFLFQGHGDQSQWLEGSPSLPNSNIFLRREGRGHQSLLEDVHRRNLSALALSLVFRKPPVPDCGSLLWELPEESLHEKEPLSEAQSGHHHLHGS